ncbi:hypothetical protein ACOMHN_065912 [Nucella lapillus]
MHYSCSLQNVPAEEKESLLLLALHREITMSVLSEIPEEAHSLMMEGATKFVQDCDIIKDKELARQVCENTLGEAGCALHIQTRGGLGAQSMACVLTHLKVALRADAQHASPLLKPLRLLSSHPYHMKKAFLPTMPEDNVEDILGGVQPSSYGPPTLWRCPKGHRYIIGDCGRPVIGNARCNVCGSQIGGAGYDFQSKNNEQLDVTQADQTQTGHILGPAAQRSLQALPERDLSPVESALLRFLTHAALYLAASNPTNRGTVAGMVQPAIRKEVVCAFFRDHLNHDLTVLMNVVSRSADDVYLILHHICHLLTTLPSGGKETQLQTKKQRSTWERKFTTVYISPIIKSIEEMVDIGNQVIVSDDRQGSAALLRMVYEMEHSGTQLPGSQQGITDLISMAEAWRYRPQISVNHFFRHYQLQVESEQQNKTSKFPIITLLRQECHIMHALHYLSAILSGQRQLIMQLHRHLDRAEATTLTIAQSIGRKECAGLQALLTNFSKAWDIVKEHLITYNCVTAMEGLVSLPEEFFNATIDEQSPLAVLLPSTQGPGLCSYILLQFLFSRHNFLLEAACPLIQQKYSSLPEVSVRMVTERHLLGCWPERDLLPLVMGHCNYSLVVGRAATLDYDYPALQQQMADSLLQCKARVQRSPQGHFPVDTMVYRADTTSARLFKILREKIDQECLSPAERRQIVEEVGVRLPDICRSIDSLNTALSFLKALGGTPSSSLQDFMETTLRMRHTVCSRKAQQLCCLKHLQSLWIVFCHQRASILASHRQDAFDSLEREFREDLTEEQEVGVEVMCQLISVDRLELLLLQLFECIVLRLSEPREQDDDTRPENFKLREMVEMNLEVPLYSKEPVEIESGLLTSANLDLLPDSLQGRHASATWTLCHHHLSKKRQLFA